MNVIRHFALRSLKKNRKWTVVTIIGVILSTAMITAVSTFSSSFMDLMKNETMASTGNWHASLAGVPASDLPAIEGEGFVGGISLSRDVGYAVLPGAENPRRPYLFVTQYDDRSGVTFPVTLADGRMPQNDSELAIPRSVEINGGVTMRVGDTLTLSVGRRLSEDGEELWQDRPYLPALPAEDGKSLDETLEPVFTRTYTVVGIMETPGYESSRAAGYTAVTYLDAGALEPGDTVDVALRAKHPSHGFFDEVDALAKRIGIGSSAVVFNKVLLRYYGVVGGDAAQRTIYRYAAVLIAIIMIASVSLIYNAFAISVSERTRQLGMLASVGATKRQKRQDVYTEGFGIGLIGIPLGILAGIGGIGVTLGALNPLMESFFPTSSGGLRLVVSPLSVAVAVVFSALTIWISAWIPARRASRIMPIDAIRQAKEIHLTGKAVKTSRLMRLVFGFEGEIGLKNLKRSRKKYRATVLSLMISLVLFLTVSYFTHIMTKVSTVASYGMNYDMAVNLYDVPAEQAEDIAGQIAGLDQVTDATVMKTAFGSMELDASQLTQTAREVYGPEPQIRYEVSAELHGLDRASFEKYARSLGMDPCDYEDPANPRAILINYGQTQLQKEYAAGAVVAMKPGDTIRVSGGGDTDTMDFSLGALTDLRPMGLLIPGFDPIALIVDEDVFTAYIERFPEAAGAFNKELFLTTGDSDALQRQIDALTAHFSSGDIYVSNIAAQAKQEQNTMMFLGVFVYGFIILIGLICVANIFNTVSTNIGLRRKEFAMLRSVGMTPGGFNKMIRYESAFYGLKALLYGLPLSVAVSLLLFHAQKGALNMAFTLPWESYGIAVALIMVIITVTMLYSSARIKRENIADALKEDTV